MKSCVVSILRAPHVLLGIAMGLGLVLSADRTHAQDRPWRVWMKTSPCAGSLTDWMAVAHDHPSEGGSTSFEIAPNSGGTAAVSFPDTPAGFADAQLMADALRLSGFLASGGAKYDNYCCKDWSVWSRTENGVRTFATVRAPGTPGPSFPFLERSNLCCEQAAAAAEGKGACAFLRLSNGRVVHFTGNGPVSLGAPMLVNGVSIPTARSLPQKVCSITGGPFKQGATAPTRSGVVSSEHNCTHTLRPTDGRMQLVKAANNGNVTISGTKWTYRSKPGYTGQESFSVQFTFPSGKQSTLNYAFSVIGRGG
jgi:hypothetical protein